MALRSCPVAGRSGGARGPSGERESSRRRRSAPGEPGTKQRIIEVTATHLARLGPRAVELRSICAELDLSPSLVNYYFRSTEDLLWQAALHSYGEHVERQTRVVSEAVSGRMAVEGWVRQSIEWTRKNPGIAALIDFPMLALEGEDGADPEVLTRDLADLSRRNVATLASGIHAMLTGRPVRMLGSAKVALLIRTNATFAYWTSMVGFGTLGAAMWVAGRRPHSFLWRAFGFSPDAQIDDVVRDLLTRIDQDAGRVDDLSQDLASDAADDQFPDSKP